MSLNIRAATPDDIEAVAKLEAESFPDPWSEASFKFFLNPKTRFAVLEDESGILGYAVTELADELVGGLFNICIAPASRQKGYSGLLMDDLIAQANAQNKQKIWLEVRESNTAAIALYKKYGFKVDGVRKNYYHNPTENGLLMTLDL